MPVEMCIPSVLLCTAQSPIMECNDNPQISCSPAAQFICMRAVQWFTIPSQSYLGRKSP